MKLLRKPGWGPVALTAAFVALLVVVFVAQDLSHRHDAEVKERIERSVRAPLEREIDGLMARETRRPASDFTAFLNGIPSPIAVTPTEKLVAAHIILSDDGSLSSPHRDAGAQEAALLKLRGGPVSMRIDQALAWASEHLPRAYDDLEEASAAVGQAIGAWYLGPYRCLRHEGRTLLIRRQEHTSGMRKLAVLVLDEARLVDLARQISRDVDPRILVAPHADGPHGFAWQIPTAVVAERSGSEDIGLALWLAAAAAGIAMILGVVALTRLRRHLARERAFTAAASHELRTPVAALRALAENLVRGIVTDPERQQTYLRTLHDESVRLATLVDNLLDQSRLDRGHLVVDARPNCIVATCKQLAEERRLDAVNLDGAADGAAADPEALRRMVINLLDNAAKYAPESRANLACGSTDRRAWIRVSDTGPGIPVSHRRTALQAWGRMPGHEHRPGLGLGLALVEALARAHGGRLELSSNTPQGLVATIWLPLNSRQADQSTDP